MPASRTRTVLLWVLAVLAMAGTAIWQRRTGPTYPKRGTVVVAGEDHDFRLIRSQETSAPARVTLPDTGVAGRVHWRRFPTQDPWSALDLRPEGPARVAELPIQPAAGKIEYFVELDAPEGIRRLPESGPVVLRYKDPVSTPVLIAHVAAMFFGVLLGLRTGLQALLTSDRLRAHAWVTLGLLTVGGLVLGPMVQKQAFGAYWTGWPFGYDLTDNKTLLMWLVWAAACVVLAWRPGRTGRWAAGLATLAMLGVYLVPHSLRGSQLDYAKVQAGADAKGAVTTGR